VPSKIKSRFSTSTSTRINIKTNKVALRDRAKGNKAKAKKDKANKAKANKDKANKDKANKAKANKDKANKDKANKDRPLAPVVSHVIQNNVRVTTA
jgi:hypothetical protein